MLTQQAGDLLDRLDHVTPKDGDEMALVSRERGWVEAIAYFAGHGLFTPDGEAEAAELIAGSGEWVDGLDADEPVMPRVPEDPADVAVVVSGP